MNLHKGIKWKRVIAAPLIGLFALVGTSCTPKTEQAAVTVNVMALKGPTAMGMVKLMEDNAEGRSNNNYNFEIVGTADEVVAKLTKGETDIAAVPANLASVLYNRTEGGIKVCAINTLGVLYIVDTTDSIKSIEDLRGKTLYSVGKGTTPEFALNYVLTKNNIIPEIDINIEYRSEATELATLLAAGEAEYAMLPEPYVTTVLAQNENLRIALSLTEEWDKVESSFNLLTGTVVTTKKFAEENKTALDTFLAEYKSSVGLVSSDLDKAAELVVKYEIVPKEPIAKQAIPRCNIVFIDGDEMKADLEGYLGTLYAAQPQSIGGAIPDDGFYYMK